MADDTLSDYITTVREYLGTARGRRAVAVAEQFHPDDRREQLAAVVQAVTGLRRADRLLPVADALLAEEAEARR